jgi:hypothetical protein
MVAGGGKRCKGASLVDFDGLLFTPSYVARLMKMFRMKAGDKLLVVLPARDRGFDRELPRWGCWKAVNPAVGLIQVRLHSEHFPCA